MQFVYKPEGAEPRKWDFDPSKLLNVEAEAIERQTGLTYAEWGEAVTKGSMTALHGLLWVLLKRDQPTLKYDAVQFCLADLDFEVDDDESAQIRADLEAQAAEGTLSEDDAALLERLTEQDATPKD